MRWKPNLFLLMVLIALIAVPRTLSSSSSANPHFVPSVQNTVDRFLTLPFPYHSETRVQQGWHDGGIDYILGEKDRASTWQRFDVLAAADGEACGNCTARVGNAVWIRHTIGGRRYYTYYGHLSEIAPQIPRGDPGHTIHVSRGQKIGVSGDDGASGLIHLHFMLKDAGDIARDPYGLYTADREYYYPGGSRYGACSLYHTPFWTTDPPTYYYPGYGHITGHVSLQGRSGNNSGARIFLDGTEKVSTGTDGNYWLYYVTSGLHRVRIERMSYLCTETQVSVSGGQTSTLPDVMLRVGDTFADGRVNIFDLVLVAQSWGTSPPRDPRADVNGDNRVNIFDLVWVD